jgi:hypothetical protein
VISALERLTRPTWPLAVVLGVLAAAVAYVAVRL